MKQAILVFVLPAFFISDAFAQNLKRFKREKPERAPLCTPKRVGIAGISVGCVAVVFGGFVYGATAPMKQGQSRSAFDPGLVMMSGGVVLVAGGIVLLVTDAAHHRKNKWSVIAPKNNEIGIEYYF